MNRAKLEELKYGDKLVSINNEGEYTFYTYLCLDPGYKEMYAFLTDGDGVNARHFYKPLIEEMFILNNFDEVIQLSNQRKAKYYREWLEKYEHSKEAKEE